MYGMVNQGVETFIKQNHGDQAWADICAKAGLSDTNFTQMQTYDDKVTYDLVGAICDFTDLDAAKVLEVFGEFWVQYAEGSQLGRLLNFAGTSFVETLEALDDMHERVRVTMPDLQPPSFEVEELDDETVELHYYSDRPGLAPMVRGLLTALAARHDQKIAIEQTDAKDSGADHDVFRITLLE